jgi:hypothetical protein
MADGSILERIGAWEAEGLIDAATAARLRAAEIEHPAPPPVPSSGARSAFGPAPTVSEVLGYVGGAFLLAAWYVLVGRTSDSAAASGVWTLTFGVAALATAGLGFVLKPRGERGARAAGILFAIAVANAYGAGYNMADDVAWSDNSVQLLVAGLVALPVALILRSLHPALLTQAGVLGSVPALALGIGAFAKTWLLPAAAGQGVGGMALDLAPWLGAALVLGLIGLRESRTAGEPSARRAALSRFAAGLTAVTATAAILTRSGPTGSPDEYGYDYGRLLEPVIAVAAVAVVSVVLLWLAFRRGATAYLYPAAIGIVIALTDLNGSYVADQVGTGVALMIEGIVILGAGLVADRVRRRLAVG